MNIHTWRRVIRYKYTWLTRILKTSTEYQGRVVCEYLEGKDHKDGYLGHPLSVYVPGRWKDHEDEYQGHVVCVYLEGKDHKDGDLGHLESVYLEDKDHEDENQGFMLSVYVPGRQGS